MNRLFVAILALGMVCGASSCSMWRKVTGRRKVLSAADSAGMPAKQDTMRTAADTALVKQDTVAVIPHPAIDLQKLALIQQWLPRWNAQTSYNTFSGKAKVHYEGAGASNDFTVVIRMEKNKRIWISITALGIFEAARALITPDTIIAIDRIHKEVRILPVADAGKLLPANVDFASLQALIIGDVIHTGRQPDDAVNDTYSFKLRSAALGFLQEAEFANTDSSMRMQHLSADSTFFLIQYTDYSQDATRRFANSRVMQMSDGAKSHVVTMDFSKATFDEPVDMSFSIPAKYERK